MNLNQIITAIRQRMPQVGQRVFGAARWAAVQMNEQTEELPCCYVVPLSEEPNEQVSAVDYRQDVTMNFAVIVMVGQKPEQENGHLAVSEIDELEEALFRSILNWQQEPKAYFTEIRFEGGSLLYMDSSRLAWQFEFSYQITLGPGDTYQPTELAALPPFTGADIKVDAVDPSHKKDQPDGQIETEIKVNF